METIPTYLHRFLPTMNITYIPLVILGVLIIILIIAGFLSRRRISKLKLLEKLLTGYTNCGVNKDGKPTLR